MKKLKKVKTFPRKQAKKEFWYILSYETMKHKGTCQLTADNVYNAIEIAEAWVLEDFGLEIRIIINIFKEEYK